MHEHCPIPLDKAPPAPTAGDVHLWRISLKNCDRPLDPFMQVLSPEERDRAERLGLSSKRHQFVMVRSQLRTILGHYVNLAPQDLEFQYTPRGKPSLAANCSPHISFNLAHSQQLALIAIATHRRVGVDVEAIRPIRLEALAKRFLQPAEIEWLFSMGTEQRQEAFFRLWTCKEAYLKATGEGLVGLHRVQIAWNADQPILHPQEEAGQWSLQTLTIDSGFAAALVVEGEVLSIQKFDAKPDSMF